MLKALTAKAIAEAKLEQLEAMDETVSSVGFSPHATATDWFCSPLKHNVLLEPCFSSGHFTTFAT